MVHDSKKTALGSRIDLQGDRRVVIEGHRGLVEYGDTCMRVAVRGGAVKITGMDLELLVMNKSDLVIGGVIAGLELLP